MYLIVFPMLLPWVVPLVIGMIEAGIDLWKRRRDSRLVLAFVLVVVPLVVMTFFRDRKDRYALPMIPPAAVLAGAALARHVWERRQDRWILVAQWALVGAIALGLPIAGFALLRTIDGSRWYTPVFATAAAGYGAITILVGILMSRRTIAALFVATLAIMLGAQAMFMDGYRDAREGRSEMRPLADAIVSLYPDAEVINGRTDGKRLATDLAIYLNRSTRRVDEWRALAPGERPWVVVLQQRPTEPEPIAPDGWVAVAKVKRDADWYYAFALKPARE
jgi:4-amino-4-deoxy-L-arabinose transferase-like glycosyltransferase